MAAAHPTIAEPQVVRKGLTALKRADPVLADMIRQVGPFRLKPSRERYTLLVRSILSQQISVAAARTIRQRLVQRMPRGRITARYVSELSIDDMRALGISRQKAGYLLDLSQKVQDGSLNFRRVAKLDDEGVIEELIHIRGIGRWTAQMFLIFGLGRVNVFPPDDLGIRAAIRRAYALPDMPTVAEANEIAAAWAPYSSIATWYCWRSLE